MSETSATCLMERSNAGTTIELWWEPLSEFPIFITIQEAEAECQIAAVSPDKALDAFWHPYCYLPRPHELAAIEEFDVDRIDGIVDRIKQYGHEE